MSRLEEQLRFLEEIDQFKNVERVIPLQNGRLETDAEHTWHLAMFLLVFDKDLPVSLDRTKMFRLALVHDLAEVYAGDPFAFDTVGRVGKADKELVAAKKLFSLLPSDLSEEFLQLFLEYENKSSAEARVVKAFDKLQPLLSHYLTQGRLYRDKAITQEIVEEYNKPHFGEFRVLDELNKKLIALLAQSGSFSSQKQTTL
ncbi:MAG: HD domain-containing protein [Candidatus Woesearchaeota archaeon]